MRYTTELDSDRKIIKVTVTGALTRKDLLSMGLAIRLKAQSLQYRIIFDFRRAENYVTCVEGIRWYGDQYDNNDPHLKYIPTAHLANEEERPVFQSVETSFMNGGIRVKLFSDSETAVAWLESM